MDLPVIIVLVVLVVIVLFVVAIVQRPDREAQPRRRGLRPDRRPAQAPPRSHPEPRERGQGLHGLRAGRPDEGHRGARERRSPPGARAPAAQAQAENVLTGTLRSLFAVVENYPELKANENVLEPAGAADHDREPDQLLAPALQRHRPRLQQRASRCSRASSSPARSASRKREFFEAEPEAQAGPGRRTSAERSRSPRRAAPAPAGLVAPPTLDR